MREPLEKTQYIVSAVVKGHYCEDSVYAYTDRQAWYFFAKKHGFAMRDFKILGKLAV